jgi:uncharacterized protein (TIGR00255 family)
MIASMTAFARKTVDAEWGSATWEIKSVNQRFMEPNFRLPETFRKLEMKFRESIRDKLNRGKLDCSLRYELKQGAVGELKLNEVLLNELVRVHKEIASHVQHDQPMDIVEMMRWPELLKSEDVDLSQAEKDVVALFSATIDELIVARQREGESLKQMLIERIQGVAEQVEIVKSRMPDIVQAQKDKLRARLEELEAELDNDRLEQELVLFAQKVDVDEEMDRLQTHINEVTRILNKGGVVGRKLDFLMQEFNREANTCGSKSVDKETTNAAVEMKVLIEQMREQIQNIE